MEDFGFIMLSRKAFQSEMWEEERELSKFEAWLDLIATAAFADHERIVLGRFIHLKRGELVASVRYLATRWRWKKTSVDRFLHVLQDRSKIGTRNETGITIISLCNYERYNTPGLKSGTANGTRSGHARDTLGTKIIRERTEEGKEQDAPPSPLKGEGALPKKKKSVQCDEEWIDGLKSNQAYEGIDIRRELGKAQTWAESKRRQCTRMFFLNWINRIQPITAKGDYSSKNSYQLEHISGDTL